MSDKKPNQNKEKFKFVHQEDDFLLDDEEGLEEVEKTKIEQQKKRRGPLTEAEKIEARKRDKRRKVIRYVITISVMIVMSGIFFGIVLLWQRKTTFLAITNALSVACVMVFFVGWIMLMWNYNIFSPLIHAIKTFGLMIVGKRPKLSYYEYQYKIKSNPIPKFYIFSCFITALVLLIPSIIMIVKAMETTV